MTDVLLYNGKEMIWIWFRGMMKIHKHKYDWFELIVLDYYDFDAKKMQCNAMQCNPIQSNQENAMA